jgi:hypothetical protein
LLGVSVGTYFDRTSFASFPKFMLIVRIKIPSLLPQSRSFAYFVIGAH